MEASIIKKMTQLTLHGHSLWDISSMLQKAIRRCDFERAGYAAYEMYGKYKAYLWRRLIQISAEDVWGIMTNEIVGLYYADCICSNGRKGYEADPIFVAKAVTLLCMARKTGTLVMSLATSWFPTTAWMRKTSGKST